MLCDKCNENTYNYKVCEGRCCDHDGEVNIICDDCAELLKNNDKMILCYLCIDDKNEYYSKKLSLEINKLKNLENPKKLFSMIEKTKTKIFEIRNILNIIE